MEVDLLEECEIEPYDIATKLGTQFSARFRFDVLLMSYAPVDVLESRRLSATPWSGPGWLRALGTLLPAWISQCWVRPMLCLGSAVEVV